MGVAQEILLLSNSFIYKCQDDINLMPFTQSESIPVLYLDMRRDPLLAQGDIQSLSRLS